MDKRMKLTKTQTGSGKLIRLSKVGINATLKSQQLKGTLFFPRSKLYLVRRRLADRSLKVIGKPTGN